MLSDVVKRVADRLPPFDDHTLRQFVKREIESSIDFVSVAFAEAVNLLRPYVTYEGYEILSPEQRAEYEMTRPNGAGSCIAPSEWVLVRYKIKHNGIPQDTNIYMPYIHNNAIVIRGTRNVVQLGITQKIFSKTNVGVIVRVMRSPLQFERKRTFRLVSAVTQQFTNEFVVSLNLHNRAQNQQSREIDMTAMLYLMARYGVRGAISFFGLTNEDINFTTEIGKDVEHYEYFMAKRWDVKLDPVYMRVKRSLLSDTINRKICANILYTLTHFARQSVDDLEDPNGTLIKVFMGQLLFKDTSEIQARPQAELHLKSVDYYLDAIAQKTFKEFGVNVSTIYELIKYVFIEIDRVMVTSASQDLYDKKIDVIQSFLIEAIVQFINKSAYRASQNESRLRPRPNQSSQKSRGIFKVGDKAIRRIAASMTILQAPSVVTNNYLLSESRKKIRLSKQHQRTAGSGKAEFKPHAPEHRFNTSAAGVETLIAFSGKMPGLTGDINPFLQITRAGGIIKPPYAAEADVLQKHVPLQS